jgi:outer membrane protein OmpA-like peptidoglycan-associated protein
MTNRCLLGVGVALAVALGGVQAHAQLFPSGTPLQWYIGPEGGWTSLTSQSESTSSVSFVGPGPAGSPPGTTQIFRTPGFNATPNTNSGFNVGARGGVQWGPFRFEEEYSYRNNQLSNSNTLNILGPFGNTFTTTGGRTQGQATSNAIMTNALYDFGTWAWNWFVPITPHIGAGVGAVHVDESVSINSFTLPNSIGAPISPATPLSVQGPQTFGGTLLNGSGWRFGYQGIAGVRFEFSPAVAFDLDYRYLGTTNQTFTNNASARYPFPNGNKGVNCCAGGSFTSKYNSNNLVASITMKFGAPPPPPPPPLPPAPPPPPPQKVFLVFFDWDKYNITPEGQQIIALAAQQYKAGGSVRIQVTGYTDLSGSAGYNQRLSERRANAVANALAAQGVARSDMAVTGRGMNDPRVPTAPGVREPQNRRVEIVFP